MEDGSVKLEEGEVPPLKDADLKVEMKEEPQQNIFEPNLVTNQPQSDLLLAPTGGGGLTTLALPKDPVNNVSYQQFIINYAYLPVTYQTAMPSMPMAPQTLAQDPLALDDNSTPAPLEESVQNDNNTETSTESGSKETVLYKCLHCERSLSAKSLSSHYRLFNYCRYCELQLQDYQSFYSHVINVHSSKDKCFICKKNHKNEDDRIEHAKRHTQMNTNVIDVSTNKSKVQSPASDSHPPLETVAPLPPSEPPWQTLQMKQESAGELFGSSRPDHSGLDTVDLQAFAATDPLMTQDSPAPGSNSGETNDSEEPGGSLPWNKREEQCLHCNEMFLCKRISQHYQRYNFCKYCVLQLCDYDAFITHVSTVHLTDTKCLICNRNLHSQEEKDKHAKSHSTPNKRTTKTSHCASCDISLGDDKSLLEHMRFHFSNGACNHCGGEVKQNIVDMPDHLKMCIYAQTKLRKKCRTEAADEMPAGLGMVGLAGGSFLLSTTQQGLGSTINTDHLSDMTALPDMNSALPDIKHVLSDMKNFMPDVHPPVTDVHSALSQMPSADTKTSVMAEVSNLLDLFHASQEANNPPHTEPAQQQPSHIIQNMHNTFIKTDAPIIKTEDCVEPTSFVNPEVAATNIHPTTSVIKNSMDYMQNLPSDTNTTILPDIKSEPTANSSP